MTSGKAIIGMSDKDDVTRVLVERQLLSRIQKEQEEKDRCVPVKEVWPPTCHPKGCGISDCMYSPLVSFGKKTVCVCVRQTEG